MYKVFMADDEKWALMSLKKLIDWPEHGFTIVGEATDGVQAYERIRCTKPDLVISDIRMPDMDGLELLCRLREDNLDTDVLLVSGYSEFEYAREAIRLGCKGYLLKPVDKSELIQYLNKLKSEWNQDNVPNAVEEVGYQSEKVLSKRIMQYISENYADRLTLPMLAEHFQMGTAHISVLLKKVTGKSFGEHLLEVRIQQAQKLLKTTDDSIEGIALQVGYADYFYFTKVFKKATGISPSTFRKQF